MSTAKIFLYFFLQLGTKKKSNQIVKKIQIYARDRLLGNCLQILVFKDLFTLVTGIVPGC